MSTINHILSTAQSSLQAAQATVAVANNNIANVSTPGWAREVLPLRAELGGMGVISGDPQAIRDALLERTLSATSGRLGHFEGQVAGLNQLEVATNDLDGSGLGVALRDFGAALSNASANPGGTVERDQILQSAETLSGSFQTTRAQFTEAGRSTLETAQSLADRANLLTQEIANLNVKIQRATGTSASALVAQRADRVSQLSSIVGVHSVRRTDGTVQLETAGGQPLVESGFASQLTIERGAPPASEPEVVVETQDGQTLGLIGEIGGQLGGTLDTFNETITPGIETLDEMAYHFMDAFNSAHEAGFNLNGNTNFQFFELPSEVEGAASAMELSRDVDGFPEHIAAALDPGSVPGGNENLLKLQALIEQDGVLPSGESVEHAWNGIVNDVAYGLVRARAGVDLETASLEQVSNMLASETGVSIDEELIKVTQANAALEASSTVIDQVQQMTNTILSLVR